jgi:hypothetical protein
MKKFVSAIALILLLIAAALWWTGFFENGAVKVRLRQSEIDAILVKRFPIEKKHLKLIRITYTDPVASIVADTGQVRIGVTAQIRVGIKPFEKDYQAKATLLSDIDYDPAKHTFFLRKPVCEHLDLPKIPAEYLELTREALNLTTAGFWEKIPVYEWKPRDRTQELARMVLHDIKVEKDALVFILKLPENSSSPQ